MPAVDSFAMQTSKDLNELLQAPAENAAAVTPHNTNELAYVSRALYVGTGGNVKVTMMGGQEVIFYNVPSGDKLPIRVKIVWSTGTTAQNILTLW